MNRRFTLIIVGLLALSLLAPVAIAADEGAQPNQTSNDTANETDGYTLAELRQDGKHYSVPSARIVPEEQRVYWLEHTPANQPWRTVTAEENGPKFASGQTLQTNTVYLRTIRAEDTTESVNVTVVVWEPETRTVKEGNTTTTERYAANVTTVTKQVQLGPGWAVGAIDIPNHDEKKHVTMWIEGHEDTARWTFEHESVAFTTPIDIDNYAEFVLLGGAFIILPALGTGIFGTRKVRSWMDDAGAPPGHGAIYYSIIATLATGAGVLFIYMFMAEVIVSAPVVLGIGVGVIYIGFMLATHEGNTTHKLAWQPHIESVEAFASTKMPSIGSGASEEEIMRFSEDMPFGQIKSLRILDEGQDGLSLVQDGWVAFLSRLKGGRAKIENAHELRTRMSLWDSPWDEMIIVDPEADTLMEYERPGLSLRVPDIDSWHDLVWPAFWLAGGAGIAWQLAQIYGAVAWATLAVGIPYLTWKFAVVGTDSYVHIDPAPVAMRPVLASMFAMNVGYDDATSLEDAEEFAWRALAGQDTKKKDWERRRDETFVDETFGDAESNETDVEDDPIPEDRNKDLLDDIDQIPVATDGGDEDE